MGPVYDHVPKRECKSAYVSAARFRRGCRHARMLCDEMYQDWLDRAMKGSAGGCSRSYTLIAVMCWWWFR